MKIGINAFFQYSFFSNGAATAMLSLATALETLGHTIVLVNTNGSVEWFEDCLELKDKYTRRNLCEWQSKGYDQLDMCIDIDGFIISTERRRIAKRVIVFIRKPVFLNEMEKSVYPIQGPIRNLRECDAVWCWEEFGAQDAHILELLSERPVYRIPFTWSPSGVEAYTKNAKISEWLDSASTSAVWEAHIAESNTTVASSITLPMVIMGYAKTHAKIPMKSYYVHNAQQIEKEAFFKDNVYAHCKRKDLDANFVGRQRICDWRNSSKSFILAHNRFLVVKPYLLDAVWNGIPVIHNSPYLRDIGLGLEKLYYADNSVKGAAAAMDGMVTEFELKQGIFAPGRLAEIRGALLEKFNPTREGVVTAWNAALMVATHPSSQTIKAVDTSEKTKKVLRIGFSDFWQDANSTYNFWTLLLTEACRAIHPDLTIQGVDVKDGSEQIDLLIFGPFGNTWQRVPASIPKIHTTGENTRSISAPDVILNFGFDATDLEKGIYRFPLWKQYIDWFGADQDRLRNPRTMPLSAFKTIPMNLLKAKKKFCAFVVSNPSNEHRNSAFKWLNTYKPVDSAGRLFNTCGDVIFAENAGGGGGELKKLEFLKEYKFCITYENSRTPGYVTEKLLAAKAAGCIPIYWGAEDVDQDFAAGSFINANSFTTAEDLIAAVKDIDLDEEKWLSMASRLSFDIDVERKELATVARLVLGKVLPASDISKLPEMLGVSAPAPAPTTDTYSVLAPVKFKTSGEIKRIPGAVGLAPQENIEWNKKTLLVTFATQQYIDSLKQWLASAVQHKGVQRGTSIRVYFGSDISPILMNVFYTEYPEVEFCMIPTETVSVEGFPDLWMPQHFAWKLWIYQQLVSEKALVNTRVWYTDAGSILVRWPTEWFSRVDCEGICMLEDSEQKNEQWCHAEFCKQLSVSKDELDAQQTVAGIVSFIAGAEKPWKLFEEAWKWAQIRTVLVGPKWAGQLPDGRPFGHRHDQSILSILRLRYAVPMYPLDKIYCHESLRRTFKSGASLYVHRGQIKEHVDFAPKIGEIHVINLPRRSDRLKQFKDTHGAWTKAVCLRPAVDGRSLALTPNLVKLFGPNDFFWKKAIMGCALSHLSLYLELAAEPEACANYLILEDDVVLQKDWLERWPEMAKDLPDDYDIVYLGGVLPPNRKVFDEILEPVNKSWARIKHNQIFGQQTPTRNFHFCAYAYILSRKAAQKILQGIGERGGYHTSADHILGQYQNTLNVYISIPLLAGCFQDNDPAYQASQFNNFSRIDSFDSDLWNNDERFTTEECKSAYFIDSSPNVNLGMAVADGYRRTVPVADTVAKGRFTTVGTHTIVPDKQPEYKWHLALFGDEFAVEKHTHLPVNHTPLTTKPIFIVCKPHWKEYLDVFLQYEAAKCEFYAVHISDEFLSDPIDWYTFKMCKGVLRNYPRKDCAELSHVKVFPLGPGKWPSGPCGAGGEVTRDLVWSFFGTKWMDREKKLECLKGITPNAYTFFDAWLDAKQLGEETYGEMCRRSIFVPCPKGQNVECFRLYEALEYGCIPLLVREPGDELYVNLLVETLDLRVFGSWEEAKTFVTDMMAEQEKEKLTLYCSTLQSKWGSWKLALQEMFKILLGL